MTQQMPQRILHGLARRAFGEMPEMSDPFNILGDEFDIPPTFDEAVKEKVARFQTTADRFQALLTDIGPEAFTDHEWGIVERAADDLEESIERAEEGYVAVQYDSHAWYRIAESLDRISLRLESAIHLMETVRQRTG